MLARCPVCLLYLAVSSQSGKDCLIIPVPEPRTGSGLSRGPVDVGVGVNEQTTEGMHLADEDGAHHTKPSASAQNNGFLAAAPAAPQHLSLLF